MRNLRLLFLVGLATAFISEKLFVSSQSPSSQSDDLYLDDGASGDLPIDDEDGEHDGSGSGSGDYVFSDFTDQEEKLMRILNASRTTVAKEMVPNQPQPTADSPQNPPTTAVDGHDRPTTRNDWDNKEEGVAVGTGPTADRFPQSTSLPPIETTSTFSLAEEDNSLDGFGILKTNEGDKKDLMEENGNEIVAVDGRGSRMFDVESPEEVTSENMWERTDVLAAVIACGVVGFLCAVFLLLLLAYRMKKKDEGSYDLGDTKLSTTGYHKAPTKEFYA